MNVREESLGERLDRHSMPVTECGCQVWLMSTGRGGYGQLKASTGTHKSIAQKFGVCKATVSHIKSGRQWGHI